MASLGIPEGYQTRPMNFVHEIRLDQETYLLSTTQRSSESVAFAVGYKNVSTLRTLARRCRGSTLTELTRRRR